VNAKPIAVIPVAGVGSRLRPHTHTVPKSLINVAGKPMLAHILDELEKIGIDEAVFVIGHMGDKIAEYVRRKHPGIKSSFVEQPDPKGLGHAIWLTKQAVGERPALIILGDTLFRADFKSVLAGGVSSLGVKEVDDPRRFGVAIVEEGRISRLVEKPDTPISRLAIVGIYYLIHSGLLYECLDELIEKGQTTKGEYQLTDALELMLKKGEPMTVFRVDGWYDCGKTETLLSTNQELLDLEARPVTRKGSVIIDPVAIHETAVIEDSIIGPHVSVAAGAAVRCAVVKNSIINENATVELILLDGSLIGEQAVVKGHYKKLNVGDSSEIEMA
jgi:glucose-1-phosphate thymidylyltransferase